MATIEGRLGALGIHDVFQLLDVGRRSGVLQIESEARGNRGAVGFAAGRVVTATIRSNPHRLGDLLVRSGRIDAETLVQAQARQTAGDGRRLGEILVALGAVSAEEIARQMRLQIEAVVFELLSWQEGRFHFVEGAVTEGPAAELPLGVDALLLEGARRLDEWAELTDRVPSIAMVPVLQAPEVADGRLELRPAEWEVLSHVDGRRDLRGIAVVTAMSEFDVARVAYGLLSAGLIALRAADVEAVAAGSERESPAARQVQQAREAVERGNLVDALTHWAAALDAEPDPSLRATIVDGLDSTRRLHQVLRGRGEG
ncbi:MAG: DUF4388 domain-containing protein [Gemmatimonadota bacterium]|jgi:hypothetical protein|nr:DUF4388 domain-containing protein [Gemmatimonadota bacterium]MDQ8147918.1 DUF4388 domain-containing protein [Gemmatimonadota bacterium]MDQ8149614.1 DUF4388 domain-containing protein [Gemmatimonadota bacterium]MDQ8157471.1 DUF4388 domain-containing protein [Gemmatimonadota bacterium]MDQ8177282.1 DUF4388 domain-containing protein [Gemmatimonadota bacterium]